MFNPTLKASNASQRTRQQSLRAIRKATAQEADSVYSYHMMQVGADREGRTLYVVCQYNETGLFCGFLE